MNAAAVSFQNAPNVNSKLLGLFDLKDAAIRNKGRVKAVKVATTKNVADMFTKCLPGAAMSRLMQEVKVEGQRAVARAQGLTTIGWLLGGGVSTR